MHGCTEDSGELILFQIGKILRAPNLVLPWTFPRGVHLTYGSFVGKHPIPIRRSPYPLAPEVRLDDIVGVHPAVLRMLMQPPAESILGLPEVSDALIDDIYGIPRIGVVPVRGGSGYWAWIGVRAYLRLVDCGWKGKFTVLDYGSRMPEEKLVYLAQMDWAYASAIAGPNQRTDRAFAQLWEANSGYVCRPVKSGSRRPSGLKAFAKLRGLDPRRLQADKTLEEPESAGRPETTTYEEEEGSKD